eukprot:CAMPEP_0167824602 /NCGR_PEP_ID=MMETSP0112_2-20121227/8888_1 /TAXON_ID=91324 /ORGANISM="Lotharella globosa, Strain CCCM811" /LENGTH=92 /DNA_ID=CAMNT_0007726589 /DNA_START=887 /DNA_END=1165 /DNA_ORIENTATION=+
MTTIELREKKNNSDRFIRHRFLVAHAKFDNGYWNNFTEVFGPPWMWLLPIFPGGKGTYLGTAADHKGTYLGTAADHKGTISSHVDVKSRLVE